MSNVLRTLYEWKKEAISGELRSFSIGVGVDGITVIRLVEITDSGWKTRDVSLSSKQITQARFDLLTYEVKKMISTLEMK